MADALERMAVARDNQAWSYVIHQAGADIERVASRVAGESDLATDAVQETLLQIRDYAGSFRRGADGDDPDAAARRWILRVAVNTTCKLIRTRVRLRARHRKTAEAAVMPMESPSAVVERRERDEAVRAALVQLPPRQSEAIVLHHIEGLKFTQVAAAMGCPVGTAKTNVRCRLETLRLSLGRAGMALSLTAIVGALNGLQAATIATGAAGAVGLLSAQGNASAFALTKTAGGLVMAVKITMVFAAILAAAITPYALTQEQKNAMKIEQAPPIQAEPQPAEAIAEQQSIAENQAMARGILKNGVLPAAVQFQAGGYIDQDSDGIGEYGFLRDMSGKGPATAQWKDFNLLGNAISDAISYGYHIAMYLPDGKGGARTEPDDLLARSESPEAIQAQERAFIALAWPVDQAAGRESYAITQFGQLYVQPYDGRKPEWNDVADNIDATQRDTAKWQNFRRRRRPSGQHFCFSITVLRKAVKCPASCARWPTCM